MNKKQIKDYQQYIQCICAIDIEAAEYIYEYFKEHPHQSASRLSGMFMWSATPQGPKYWSNISAAVDKMMEDQ